MKRAGSKGSFSFRLPVWVSWHIDPRAFKPGQRHLCPFNSQCSPVPIATQGRASSCLQAACRFPSVPEVWLFHIHPSFAFSLLSPENSEGQTAITILLFLNVSCYASLVEWTLLTYYIILAFRPNASFLHHCNFVCVQSIFLLVWHKNALWQYQFPQGAPHTQHLLGR